MRKISAKWVPKCLKADKKRQGGQLSEQIWNFFGAIQMISCRDWWPWTKPGYITMTRRQSNNQCSGGIEAHSPPPPKKIRAQNPLEKFSPRFFAIKTASSSLIISQRAKLSKQSITHLCLSGTIEGLVLARQCPGSPGTCNQDGLTMSWSPTLFYGSGPVGLPPVRRTETTIEMSPFFVRIIGHCCRGDLVVRTTFWISFEWLAKARVTG